MRHHASHTRTGHHHKSGHGHGKGAHHHDTSKQHREHHEEHCTAGMHDAHTHPKHHTSAAAGGNYPRVGHEPKHNK